MAVQAIAVKVWSTSPGLLNYVNTGREAAQKIRKVLRRTANAGRTAARRKIASEFQVRSGFLLRQSRKMQTNVTVKSHVIKAEVKPIPRLMNIFERGATLARGRGILRPRPVVAPAQGVMDEAAIREINHVLREVGQ